MAQASKIGLNPFRAGRCLSTPKKKKHCAKKQASQSLSSRAMSFDKSASGNSEMRTVVSIPFEQGDVFRLRYYGTQGSFPVLIPFEQDDVFRLARSLIC